MLATIVDADADGDAAGKRSGDYGNPGVCRRFKPSTKRLGIIILLNLLIMLKI